jgi:hypothetical protein
MRGSIKIIGTNATTLHLQDKTFDDCSLINDGKIHNLFLNKDKYLFDIKETVFLKDHLMIFGMISDDAKFVGNIGLEFFN